jgi:hypothetical protein
VNDRCASPAAPPGSAISEQPSISASSFRQRTDAPSPCKQAGPHPTDAGLSHRREAPRSEPFQRCGSAFELRADLSARLTEQLAVDDSSIHLRLRIGFSSRRLKDFPRGVQVDQGDANTDHEVRPDRIASKCHQPRRDDGDVRDRVVACREERGLPEAAVMLTVRDENECARGVYRQSTEAGEGEW